jgi:DnaK suppressor protein
MFQWLAGMILAFARSFPKIKNILNHSASNCVQQWLVAIYNGVRRTMANSHTPHPQNRRLYFEQRLRQRQQELEQALASTVAQALAANPDDTRDVADQAVAGYQKELLFSQGAVRNAQLRLVRQALDRLAEGTFGECVRCDQSIGAKRIEALPWTPYCIHCQEQIENGDVEPSASVA